ncbi:DNA primase large subunit Spp2 [Knufia obscura]|uniref:Pre-mRNA-splicing factor n=2 Tax=Knufia TaxID=430999 RepID=A0AAN8F573_9EURO|nr:DNA primase large subunit Spp2 [Knufia obscura]KAK5951581.1 DNA primase large subunit Spp2 [Knufia fluminis]
MSSKPISFGFGKPKGQSPSTSTSTSTPASKTSISLSLPGKAPLHKSAPKHSIKPSALRDHDDEDPDDEEPQAEELTGFGASGAILSRPVEHKKELVIENAGNADWRRKAQAQTQATQGRGKNLLPAAVQVLRSGGDVVMVEKDEVSKASGLQFAGRESSTVGKNGTTNGSAEINSSPENKPKTADEEALQALLADDENRPRGTAVIEAAEDARDLPAPTEDFASLVAAHPDSATLDEYAAMPVEEFGMAMLRGMGKKRRANGEVISLESTEQKEVKKRKQEGYLGIGAKAAKGMEGVELGAWGKADMRKNQRGEGFFTPVMVRDKVTGETISEEELERRKRGGKEGGGGGGGGNDWRERRDRNLEKKGRGDDGRNDERDGDSYKDKMSSFSRRAPEEDDGHESSRSRRHRSRSRSREKRRRNDDEGYDSRSSGGRRDRDRDRDRDRRHRDRDRDYDRDDRRHRDRDRR